MVIPELRRAEAHLQLFDSLENLTRAVNDVFGQITSRVRIGSLWLVWPYFVAIKKAGLNLTNFFYPKWQIQDEKKRLDSLKGRIDLADVRGDFNEVLLETNIM